MVRSKAIFRLLQTVAISTVKGRAPKISESRREYRAGTYLFPKTRPESLVFSLWRESGFTHARAMFYGPRDGPAVSWIWT